jgi:hypothetical protein
LGVAPGLPSRPSETYAVMRRGNISNIRPGIRRQGPAGIRAPPPSCSRRQKGPIRTVSGALDHGQRTYDHAIREFVAWYCSEPRLAFPGVRPVTRGALGHRRSRRKGRSRPDGAHPGVEAPSRRQRCAGPRPGSCGMMGVSPDNSCTSELPGPLLCENRFSRPAKARLRLIVLRTGMGTPNPRRVAGLRRVCRAPRRPASTVGAGGSNVRSWRLLGILRRHVFNRYNGGMVRRPRGRMR